MQTTAEQSSIAEAYANDVLRWLTDLEAEAREAGKHLADPVIFTIDPGQVGTAKAAMPILKQRGLSFSYQNGRANWHAFHIWRQTSKGRRRRRKSRRLIARSQTEEGGRYRQHYVNGRGTHTRR